MGPIRVGLIGLTSSSGAGTNWAANAHLPYLRASPHYKIVALLNSTIDSAREAIRKYDLPSETKAYGNPEGEFSIYMRVVRMRTTVQISAVAM